VVTQKHGAIAQFGASHANALLCLVILERVEAVETDCGDLHILHLQL
jgi:hypothetical protein